MSVRPEIADYATLPNDLEGLLMQLASIRLITGFESLETRKQAWLQLTANFDARGIPWRDPKGSMSTDNAIIMMDIPAANDSFIYRLNLPMARNLNRHKRLDTTFYAPLYDDPVVAARLSQLDTEFAQLREQVSEMMQEPEWNQ